MTGRGREGQGGAGRDREGQGGTGRADGMTSTLSGGADIEGGLGSLTVQSMLRQ